MKMQNKIKKTSVTTEETQTSNDMKKLLILVLVVTAIFFIFYGITILIMKKDKNKETDPEKNEVTKIDMENILINQILEQPEEKYYVLLTIENDANNTTYESLKEEYYKKEDHLKIYRANINDPMNKMFVGDETTLQGEVKDFRFSKSTLVEIENKTIKTITEGSTDILAKLNDMK